MSEACRSPLVGRAGATPDRAGVVLALERIAAAAARSTGVTPEAILCIGDGSIFVVDSARGAAMFAAEAPRPSTRCPWVARAAVDRHRARSTSPAPAAAHSASLMTQAPHWRILPDPCRRTCALSHTRQFATYLASPEPCTPSNRTSRARPSSRSLGKKLREAADLARKAPTGSLGWKAATRRAEEATDRLCAIVESTKMRVTAPRSLPSKPRRPRS